MEQKLLYTRAPRSPIGTPELVRYENRINNFLNRIELPENKQTLIEFINFSKIRSLSIKTIFNYTWLLTDYLNNCKKPVKEIQRKDIENFLLSLHKKSKATQVVYRATIIAFHKWLEYGRVSVKDRSPDIVSWFEIGKIPHRINDRKELLTPAEVKQLASAAANTRDRAIILFLYESMVRIGELEKLTIGSVKLYSKHAELTVVNGKTGPREAPIPLINCLPDLKAWLNVHPFKDNPNAPLFTADAGRTYFKSEQRYLIPLCRTTIYNILQRLAKRAGITYKRVYLHLFRASRVTRLTIEKYQESVIKKMSGHSPHSRAFLHYQKLGGTDVVNAVLGEHGLLKMFECLKCGFIMEGSRLDCEQCGSASLKEIKDLKRSGLETLACALCGRDNSSLNKYCENNLCNAPLRREELQNYINKNNGQTQLVQEAFSKSPEMMQMFLEALMPKIDKYIEEKLMERSRIVGSERN